MTEQSGGGGLELELVLENVNGNERTATYSVAPPPPNAPNQPRLVKFTFGLEAPFEVPPKHLRMLITGA